MQTCFCNSDECNKNWETAGSSATTTSTTSTTTTAGSAALGSAVATLAGAFLAKLVIWEYTSFVILYVISLINIIINFNKYQNTYS